MFIRCNHIYLNKTLVDLTVSELAQAEISYRTAYSEEQWLNEWQHIFAMLRGHAKPGLINPVAKEKTAQQIWAERK